MAKLLDESAAIALVMGSQLFDEKWYAAQCGLSFASREEAATHWVRGSDTEASPHPLFEPLWLYPMGRWRKHAPDPLSFYLSRPDEWSRSPHPLVELDTTGALADWLRSHQVAELLPAPLQRTQPARVSVLVLVDDLPRAVAWMQHLDRFSPEVTGVFCAAGVAATRILTAAAAGLPSIHVRSADEGLGVETPFSVIVEASVNPPRWDWLPDLVAALERPGVAHAQPLLLNPDFTIGAAGASYTAGTVGPLLAGHPIADAERLSEVPLPGPWPGALATRRGADGDTVLVASARLVVRGTAPPSGPPPGPPPADAVNRTEAVWRAAGFDGPNGRPLRIREGRRALRWSIDIAAGAGPIGTRWGDFHFATSLAAALDRLGQWVAIDHPETRGRASRDLDDVSLTIRGLHRVEPLPGNANLLWVISHPDQVSAEEAAAYDAVFAASTTWAVDRSRDWGFPVFPLLQCTDTTRFRLGLAEPDSGPRALFVGNSRGVLRPAVAAALETGLPLTVYGSGWTEHVSSSAVNLAGDRVANESLGPLYAAAGLVLNDHWDDMRTDGFISNRIFDVLATGARLLSDDVAGLDDVLADAVPTWRSTADFARLTSEPFEAHYPDAAARRDIAELVAAEHSFDARATTLLDTALGLVDSAS